MHKFAQVVTLLTCILHVSGSNLGQNSDHPDIIHRHSTMMSAICKFINVITKRVGHPAPQILSGTLYSTDSMRNFVWDTVQY